MMNKNPIQPDSPPSGDADADADAVISYKDLIEKTFDLAIDFTKKNNDLMKSQNNKKAEVEIEKEKERKLNIQTEMETEIERKRILKMKLKIENNLYAKIHSYEIAFKIIFLSFDEIFNQEILFLETKIGSDNNEPNNLNLNNSINLEKLSRLLLFFLKKCFLFEKYLLCIISEKECSFPSIIFDNKKIPRTKNYLIELLSLAFKKSNFLQHRNADPQSSEMITVLILRFFEFNKIKCRTLHKIIQKSKFLIENSKKHQKNYEFAIKTNIRLQKEYFPLGTDLVTKCDIVQYSDITIEESKNNYQIEREAINKKFDIDNLQRKIEELEKINLICGKDLSVLWGTIIQIGIKVPDLLVNTVHLILKAGTNQIFDFERLENYIIIVIVLLILIFIFYFSFFLLFIFVFIFIFIFVLFYFCLSFSSQFSFVSSNNQFYFRFFFDNISSIFFPSFSFTFSFFSFFFSSFIFFPSLYFSLFFSDFFKIYYKIFSMSISTSNFFYNFSSSSL